MVLYSNIQRRAQEEINQAVGQECLPADKGLLLYVTAIIKEILQYALSGLVICSILT